MTEILLSEAVAAVRRYIDEAGVNTSEMFPAGMSDTTALDDTIEGMVAQAINDICAIAPAHMMQGISIEPSHIHYIDTTTVSPGFAIIGRVARIVAIKAVDSDVVLTGYVNEASPEGRMQLNPYTRGTYDNPVLVRLQHKIALVPDPGKTYSAYRYYTLKDSLISDTPFEFLEYYPIAEQSDDCEAWDSETRKFMVPDMLKETIIRHLTGLVLTIYGEADKARFYLQNISNTQE